MPVNKLSELREIGHGGSEVSSSRRNARFPTEADTPPVRFENALGQVVKGELTNESYSGVAVLIPSAEGLVLGQEVAVEYFGHPTPGTIRRLTPEPAGNWLVGIEWK